MVFQQFAGINGVQFYASETFKSAGNNPGFPYITFHLVFDASLSCETYSISVMPIAGVSSKIGTIAYACLQVNHFLLFMFEFVHLNLAHVKFIDRSQ